MTLFVAAVVVSFVAAFTGLALTNNISHHPEGLRKALIVMSAFVLGGGIWSMHFVAMLAVKISQPIYYDLLQTLGSALVAILVAGLALLLLHFSARTPRLLTLAGVILGMGIVAMHFIGMLGMRGVTPVFSGIVLWLTVAVAAVTGIAAIWAAYGHRSRQNIIAGAAVYGSAVVAVHFTAMHGTRFVPGPLPDSQSVFIGDGTLAVTVTLAVFMICGTFLLAATTFITRPGDPSIVASANEPAGVALTEQRSTPEVVTTVPGKITAIEADSVFTPLVAGDSVAENVTGSLAVDQSSAPRDTGIPGGSQRREEAAFEKTSTLKIPFERDKKIHFVPCGDVGAIRADGRYTHFYTRSGTHFCPWSITEAEKRLANAGFYRTHRSYLVNLEQLSGFEKRKDSGVCLFENFAQLSSVPVSRKRIPALVQALGI